jgi:uncharacterized protein
MNIAKLLRPTLTASIMLVVAAGAAVAGKLEDAKAAFNRRDYTTGLRLLRPLAEQGDAAAQFVFGLLYYTGQGVPKTLVEAVGWFSKAAEQGDAGAQVMLGTMYRDGQGLPQNYTEAAKWYRKAAEQGDDNAEQELGVMYARGQGVPKNMAEAVKWWRKAASQGNTVAERNLEQANKLRRTEEAKERDRPRSSTDSREPIWDRTWYVRNGSWYECTGTLTSNGSCIGSERLVASPGYPHEPITGDTYYLRNGGMYECSGMLSSNNVCIGTETNQ